MIPVDMKHIRKIFQSMLFEQFHKHWKSKMRSLTEKHNTTANKLKCQFDFPNRFWNQRPLARVNSNLKN